MKKVFIIFKYDNFTSENGNYVNGWYALSDVVTGDNGNTLKLSFSDNLNDAKKFEIESVAIDVAKRIGKKGELFKIEEYYSS